MGQVREQGGGARIVVADDDAAMRSLVSDELEGDGYGVTPVADGEALLCAVREGAPDVVITDLRMPHGGLELVGKLKTIAPRTPVILMTAFGDKQTESLAYMWGASAYFNKPVRMEELKEAVRHLLEGRTWTGKGGGAAKGGWL